MRRALVVVALTVVSGGCAMSSSAFEQRSMENYERNQVRYRAAVEALKEKEYVLLDIDEGMRFATLEEPGPRRCLDRSENLHRVDAGPLEPDEPLRITIGEMTRGGEQPKPPVYVVAPAERACEFFRKQGNELAVTKEDGQPASIVRSELRTVARATNGEIVRVAVQTRILSKKKMLVKRTCDQMPRVEPDPLEHPFAIPMQWGPAPKLRTVVMTIEREELEAECTDHTY